MLTKRLPLEIPMSAHQLPLNVKLHDETIFENYIESEQSSILAILKNFVAQKSESFIYCYGKIGVGKTHLLQACCHESSDIFYLPLSDHHNFTSYIFESLEYQKIVCIDDVDVIAGNREWEEALFHFYNRAREKNVFLLVSAKMPPQQLSFLLPDLQSRLTSALILEIKPLTDSDKTYALQLRAKLRGLYLSAEITTYLIQHYSRNMRDLFHVLEKLDTASLIAKRKITIPFVKSVMQDEAFCAMIPPLNEG